MYKPIDNNQEYTGSTNWITFQALVLISHNQKYYDYWLNVCHRRFKDRNLNSKYTFTNTKYNLARDLFNFIEDLKDSFCEAITNELEKPIKKLLNIDLERLFLLSSMVEHGFNSIDFEDLADSILIKYRDDIYLDYQEEETNE